MEAFTHTKIIATLGPASADEDTIRALIRAGADCFRINFSHGDGPSHLPLIESARRAIAKENRHIPLMADIQGPKLRIGLVPPEGLELRPGARFTLTTDASVPSPERVQADYPYLTRDVRAGMRILLDDGLLELLVEKVTATDVQTTVTAGGMLYSRKGINFPGAQLSVQSLTEKDRSDLLFVADCPDLDMVAISFVRSSHDLSQARALLGNRRKIPVMAKLERPEALEHLSDILDHSDGIMVARGDLGVELAFDRVPLLQKEILRRAAERGKWAIVATQMLESMRSHPRPTRAEASDVANAILDGADAIMLSVETASGLYPVKSVEAMEQIARTTESVGENKEQRLEMDLISFASGAAGAAVQAARELKARAIVTLAGSGLTALMVSKWRPSLPILALSASEPTLRRLNVLYGVIPVPLAQLGDMETQIQAADAFLVETGLARSGDPVVIVAAIPLGEKRETNTIRFHKIRDF
ncbi:MAG: pyruvate kinase [Spirochaetales bacterium]|nr:pyruvate kinase [Spirochaetales bacterium]